MGVVSRRIGRLTLTLLFFMNSSMNLRVMCVLFFGVVAEIDGRFLFSEKEDKSLRFQ